MLSGNKKFLFVVITSWMLLVLFLPAITSAVTSSKFLPIIQCGISEEVPDTSRMNPDGTIITEISNQCDFYDFIETINRIINWIISMAGVIFTISFIYGGFIYITSGGDSGKQGKARDILWSTLKGFVIILVSWLIVYTIITTLVDQSQQGTVLKFIGNGN